ncbi:5-methyltetrahydropteroyltriglutamate--homocysteine S-methyltransferase [Dickeya dianthicola]|uniref:5-methyltetrahydropteroyltriglutamate--homocysteine S-methyltransferase n=1 Tax=Dickeya dianthicola TaxID=204039 RepID=A0AAP6RYR9_9GAMM|nr:5-methyltetrahydropteroyltriglutamate--homocysteine S-methyltransferase [Dickeya dianthicola]ATO32007.1 Methionine synthase II (cobalamin-independent) [Dickeya dianthicola RNS04.9]MBT1427119.1 5-methyltetrahydropteroyltriglutamate--homocysteine S-methyltransferase [Dickeya dianthicola]MBT1431205.1 5-methyltetrahydropteroyltriglutamate--homocysteine S-methyltransferase [Dickeya dianthicola]MBT1458638.1 5-methyltetrahydropteroyltriglutamate--homocysteine S-methyltransferase [Dickeya dianthicol
MRTVKKPYPPFHAEHVGSFLLPPRLKQARQAWRQGLITYDRLTEIENEEVLNVVERQKACGLSAITDGELRIHDGITDFFSCLTGIDVDDAALPDGDTPGRLRVVGKLDFDDAHPFLTHYRFLHQAVGDSSETLAKQTLPSPTMLMYPAIRNNDVYPSLDAFCDDLAAVYRKLIQAFYRQGCRYLQLDDLFWARLCDGRAIDRENAAGFELRDLLARCTRTLNQALAQRPPDMFVSLHICCRRFSPNWVYGSGREVMGYAMANLAVDSLFIEYDDRRPVGLEPLRQVSCQKVVLGVVDARSATLETPDSVKMAINTASLYVPLQQLAISPKCGFGHCGKDDITEEQQWAKLRHMVNIAREVWTLPE